MSESNTWEFLKGNFLTLIMIALVMMTWASVQDCDRKCDMRYNYTKSPEYCVLMSIENKTILQEAIDRNVTEVKWRNDDEKREA